MLNEIHIYQLIIDEKVLLFMLDRAYNVLIKCITFYKQCISILNENLLELSLAYLLNLSELTRRLIHFLNPSVAEARI